MGYGNDSETWYWSSDLNCPVHERLLFSVFVETERWNSRRSLGVRADHSSVLISEWTLLYQHPNVPQGRESDLRGGRFCGCLDESSFSDRPYSATATSQRVACLTKSSAIPLHARNCSQFEPHKNHPKPKDLWGRCPGQPVASSSPD